MTSVRLPTDRSLSVGTVVMVVMVSFVVSMVTRHRVPRKWSILGSSAQDHGFENHYMRILLSSIQFQWRIALIVLYVCVGTVSKEHLENGKVGMISCQVRSCLPVAATNVQVSSVAGKKVATVVMSHLGGMHHSRDSIGILLVQVGLVAQEGAEAIIVAVSSSKHDGCRPLGVFHIPRATIAQQELQNWCVSMKSSKGNWSVLIVVLDVDFTANVNEVLKAGGLSFAGS